MKTEILGAEHNITHVVPDEPIADAGAALDAAMSAKYETGCERLIFDKAAFAESFFMLSSGLAGEILQKFVNYRLKVAIVGDYSHYDSLDSQCYCGSGESEERKAHTEFRKSTSR